MKKWIKWWLFVVIFLLLVIAYGWKEYNRTQKSTFDIDVFASTTATSLVKEFEVDETSANKKYNDQVISVKGIIHSIEITDSTQRIILKGETGGVIGELEKSERKKTAVLKAGDSLILKGVCTGFLMDVILIRTIIVNQ
jgi:hypothetical protein